MVQVHLGQPNFMNYPPKHLTFTNGNKYEFLGYHEDLIAFAFKGRWNDEDLKFKENVCYFKEIKLNKGDKFIVTNLNKNESEPRIPEQVALYCPERNFSFLLYYEYFEYHSHKLMRRKYYVKNKSKYLAKKRGWLAQITGLAPIVTSPFWWLSGPEHKNYNDLWNKINENL